MPRLIVVSNRLPISVTKRSGELNFRLSPGGLATGLSSVSQTHESFWIGWSGMTGKKLTDKDRTEISRRLSKEHYIPIFLTKKQVENYYQGFSNKTIWPLFHYFPLRTIYENRFWVTYKQVNQIFCDEVVKIAKKGDRIWIHDYHLMLVPELVRQKLPGQQIGFFLHIPFPSFELFRLLPWRKEIVNGLLGADLIGFHTHDYARHFLRSVCRIAGLEHTLGKLSIDDRIVKVDAFPLGIDYKKYSQASMLSSVQQEVKRIRQKIGERKIVLSIDRLDYTKGIIERLEAFDLFLCKNPKYRGKVTLIMVAVPSRTRVGEYIALRSRLEQLVGRLNGEYGVYGWMPVWYLYRSLAFEKLSALYHVADVALVTPLRDGMNLIAKEFVAGKTDGRGVLVLSEMTGAASELGEAIIVNANNKEEIVQAIKEAIEMPVSEQLERNRLMQNRLKRYDVSRWISDFLSALTEIKKTQQEVTVRRLSEDIRHRLISEFRRGKKRLLFLDYDGTLVGFSGRPEQAGPDTEIMNLLKSLSDNPKNEVVLISGRDKATINQWLGGLRITLIAEHGAWIRLRDKDWACIEPLREDWKDTIRPILELYTDRTPRSSMEEKDFSLVWHFRRSDPELSYIRTQELRDALVNLTANMDVGVFEGNKILEVRHLGINKGRAAKQWLGREDWDFILSAGDDYTDEEMFAVMPEGGYTLKVGLGISKARFNVDKVDEIRNLLKEMAGE
ncbi:MAG: bifunctional alpha,alpha-trehalose-phosphate synthase (UDP-forming)/trehalose-phosphatase [Planctomycetota bacterium]|nr:MAG: bifunctional alpha,alpha-trehalose-phosphate synthase (UDP-forming)/trehalose-phosphatase [Planctomycetota bacterium]